jgi:hypothetical protein
MQKIRTVIMPLLLLAAVSALSYFSWTYPGIAKFAFLWDALLGLVLGAGLAVLPQWTGVQSKPNLQSGLFWVGAFLALALLCTQYVGQVTGMVPFGLMWLTQAGTRACVSEGALMGFCLLKTKR